MNRSVRWSAVILHLFFAVTARSQDLMPAPDMEPVVPGAAPAEGLSNVGFGPLHIPSQSPFQALRFGYQLRAPSTLPAGRAELRATETWINMFAMQEDEYLLDFEMLRSSVSIAYGLTDTLEVDIEFVDKSRFGGQQDGFVREFHDIFGLKQGGRDDTRSGNFAFDVAGRSGQADVSLTGSDRGSFSRELVLTAQHVLTRGTDTAPAVSGTLSLGFETNPSNDLRGERPVSVASSVSLAKGFSDVYVYLSAGFAWFGQEEFHGIDLRPIQASALAAMEWRVSEGMSFVVQYLASQGGADRFRPFSSPSHEVTIGWKGEIGPGIILEIGLIENVLVFDNSPDFGIHSGFTYRF